MTTEELRPATIVAMASTAALTAANLYYNQPLLVQLQETFHASTRAVGSIPTLTQVGYALGMLLLVPLGDMFEPTPAYPRQPHRRVRGTCLGRLGAKLGSAGLRQLPHWLEHDGPPAHRAIRSASGAFRTTWAGCWALSPAGWSPASFWRARSAVGWGTAFGWRVMFGAAACLMLLLTGVVHRYVPHSKPAFVGKYVELMRSVWALLREEPVLREAAALGACLFGSFSAFWGTLTFMLAQPPYQYGPAEVGAFGLVGAAGAIGASAAGRLADRLDKRRMMVIVVALLICAWALMWICQTHLVGMVVGVILLDAGVQGGQVTNQARIFALREDARSRLNTAYMFCYFGGGATGTWLAVALWSVAGVGRGVRLQYPDAQFMLGLAAPGPRRAGNTKLSRARRQVTRASIIAGRLEASLLLLRMGCLIGQHLVFCPLGPLALLSSHLGHPRRLLGLLPHAFVEEPLGQKPPRIEAVQALRARCLHFDFSARGHVLEVHRARRFIDLLSSRTAGADKLFHQVFLADFQLRQKGALNCAIFSGLIFSFMAPLSMALSQLAKHL